MTRTRTATPLRRALSWAPMLALITLALPAALLAQTADPRALHAATPHAAPKQAAQTAEIDIRSSLVTGRFLLGTRPYDAGDGSSYALNLVRTDDAADTLFLGYFYDTQFSLPVVAGTYRAAYYDQFGDAVPQNYRQLLRGQVNAKRDSVRDIDVPAVEVSASFRHNGQPFPQQPTETAHFFLVPTVPGERIYLGSSNLPNPPVRVLPGLYDVVYEYHGGSAIPVNQQAVVARQVRLTSSRSLTVNVRSSIIQARLTLNGEPFPNSAYDYGRIALVNVQDKDRVELGDTFTAVLERRVIHGRYNVHYRNREPGGLTPLNPDAVIAQDIVLSPRNRSISVDVPRVTVAGLFQVDGSAAPNSAYNYARVGLRMAGTDEILTVGDTYEQGFGPMPLIAGTYEAIYTRREGEQLPINVETVFTPKLDMSISGTYTLDIPTVEVALDLRLNGSPFPNSGYDYARIYAVRQGVNGAAADPILLGETFEGVLRARLLQGRYDFVYASRESTGLTPANRHAVFLHDIELTERTTIAHNFEARPVSVAATLNGAPFPGASAGGAELFVGQDRQDKVTMGLISDRTAPVVRLLLRGAYTAYYTLRDPGDLSVLPIKEDAAVGAFVVD